MRCYLQYSGNSVSPNDDIYSTLKIECHQILLFTVRWEVIGTKQCYLQYFGKSLSPNIVIYGTLGSHCHQTLLFTVLWQAIDTKEFDVQPLCIHIMNKRVHMTGLIGILIII